MKPPILRSACLTTRGRFKVKRFALFLSLLTLTACIGVSDAGEAWKSARIDPALEGKWEVRPVKQDQEEPGPHYITFVSKEDHYEVTTISPDKTQVEGNLKTVDAGAHAFGLLMQEDNAKSGMLWPYKIENNELHVFTSKESIEIETLDPAAIEKLGKDYEDVPKWEPAFTGTHVSE
jgi:hypothetical protein